MLVVKNPPASAEVARDVGLIPGSARSPRNTYYSSILAGKFHGQRSLADYSQWGYKESDTTEQLRTHNGYLLFITGMHKLNAIN